MEGHFCRVSVLFLSLEENVTLLEMVGLLWIVYLLFDILGYGHTN